MKIEILKYLPLIVTLTFPVELAFGGLPIALPNFTPIDGVEFIMLSLFIAFLFLSFFVYKLFSVRKNLKN